MHTEKSLQVGEAAFTFTAAHALGCRPQNFGIGPEYPTSVVGQWAYWHLPFGMLMFLVSFGLPRLP